MRTPEAISITVVLHNDQKKFKMPDGSLVLCFLAGEYGSWQPYAGYEGHPNPPFEREIRTPIVLFRGGQYFDSGTLGYFGGQDSGYHIIEGFSRIALGECHRTSVHAECFEVGDIMMLLRIPSARELAKRLETADVCRV